jgi:acyl dehydratase
VPEQPNGAGRFSVTAFNFAHASENRIHDDAVASQFGFRGGLVPGVAVFGYASRAVLELLGSEWLLGGGTLAVRFLHPIYDGDRVEAVAELEASGGCRVVVRDSAGVLCASGNADLGSTGVLAAAPRGAGFFEAVVRRELPEWSARRHPVLEELTPGLVLGTVIEEYGEDRRGELVERYRDDAGLYQQPGGPLPPALATELANRALVANVELGPWIHVRSAVRFLAPLRPGRFEVRSCVIGARRGASGDRVVLGVEILNAAEGAADAEDAGETVVRLEHEAIVRLSR